MILYLIPTSSATVFWFVWAYKKKNFPLTTLCGGISTRRVLICKGVLSHDILSLWIRARWRCSTQIRYRTTLYGCWVIVPSPRSTQYSPSARASHWLQRLSRMSSRMGKGPMPHGARTWISFPYLMMTSSNGNIFRVTGHLCGEFTGPWWIPRTKANDARFDVLFDLRPNKWLSKQWWGWWFEAQSRLLWRHCNVALSEGFHHKGTVSQSPDAFFVVNLNNPLNQ